MVKKLKKIHKTKNLKQCWHFYGLLLIHTLISLDVFLRNQNDTWSCRWVRRKRSRCYWTWLLKRIIYWAPGGWETHWRIKDVGPTSDKPKPNRRSFSGAKLAKVRLHSRSISRSTTFNRFSPWWTSQANHQDHSRGRAGSWSETCVFSLPVLHFKSQRLQSGPGVQLKWETHYGLLLWLSIVVKIPFHLQRVDTNTSEPIMERWENSSSTISIVIWPIMIHIS